MKTKLIILSLFFYYLTVSAQTNAQPGLSDDEISQLSSNLTMKLLLNDAQKSTVTNLLKTYRSDLSKVMSSSVQEAQNKLMSSTNEQIISLLDSKQKMKFNVISSDWWKSVQEAQNN
jgi:signal recognition particle GTPase